MKSIEQVRAKFECPICNKKTDCSFQGESANCNECSNDFDLGPKKYKM